MSTALGSALRRLMEAQSEVEVAQKALARTWTYTSLLEARTQLRKAEARLKAASAEVRHHMMPEIPLQSTSACGTA